MPTYEYSCKSCGHRLEQFQQMTAKSLKKCPKCGANKLYRHSGSGGGIIFKGSGFYATDYRKNSPSKDSKDKPPSSSKDSKSSGQSSSCKPSGCDKPGCPKPSTSDD